MSAGSPENQGADLPPLTDGPHQKRLGQVAAVATLGGLLFGYDTCVINGALSPMSDELGLDALGEGIVTATLLFGAAIGAMVMGRISDAVGRKKTIIALSILFLVGVLSCSFAPNLGVLLVGRSILGIAVGGASTVVPVFLSEMAPYEIRGKLSGRNEVMIVVGQLSAFVINAIIGALWGHIEGMWRVMLGVAALPALFLLIGMLRMPESPRWLANHFKYDEAMRVLESIRSAERAEAELDDIQKTIESDEKSREEQYKIGTILKDRWLRRILFIGIAIGVFCQTTGVNSVMYYGQIILKDAGFGENAALVANIAPGIIAVIGAFIALRNMERIDRRTTVITGFSLTAFFHLTIVAGSYLFPEGNAARPYVLLVLIILLIGSIQTCLNIAVWVLLSEIFPAQMRALAMGISVFMLWITNAFLSLVFPSIMESWGLAMSFLMFAIINVVAALTMWHFLPETRGKSLEEVEVGVTTGAIFIVDMPEPTPEHEDFVDGEYVGDAIEKAEEETH